MTTVPLLTLNNGTTIPQLGFGVFKVRPDDTAATVRQALELGYRHIDTAQMYGNERGVGQALAESGLAREEVFVTSKLDNDSHAPAAAREATARSVDALGGPMDLYLVHWPMAHVSDIVETWHTMEAIRDEGLARTIGVSNFQIPHLERLLRESATVPAVNQIEIHPYLTQDALRAFHREHGIATEAWSPIAKGAVVDDPALQAIADQTGRTVAQVVLRWHIQRGDIVFPKSTDRSRMAENLDLFGFTLTDEQISRIAALNADRRTGPDPDVFP